MKAVEISMLGEFSVKYGEAKVSDKNERSGKKWSLLKYLIAHRDREISQNELIELFWAEGKSNNPAGALKTLLHRLRAALSALQLPESLELIVNYTGSYAINRDLISSGELIIDAAEFERLIKQAALPDLSEEKQLGYYLEAIGIYKGDFLRGSDAESWVTPLAVYYRSVYSRAVHRAVDILYGKGEFGEAADICRKALDADNLDQKIHEMLIKSLVGAGERQAAKKHYDYVVDLFYNREGISPSPEVISLLDDIVKEDKEYETDLNLVKSRLGEDAPPIGAFFCEYEFFKQIYRLEIRDSRRTRQCIHICLITITDRDGGVPDGKTLTKSSERLQQCISSSLRASDIFARYSASQFIIMLLSSSHKVCDGVMRRVTQRYRSDYPKSPVKLVYNYSEANESVNFME